MRVSRRVLRIRVVSRVFRTGPGSGDSQGDVRLVDGQTEREPRTMSWSGRVGVCYQFVATLGEKKGNYPVDTGVCVSLMCGTDLTEGGRYRHGRMGGGHSP